MRNLEKHYFYLKKDFQLLTIAYKLRGGNPLEYFAKLFGGIVFAGVSASWVIHIAIFILPAKPVHPFLNNFFVTLTDEVPGFPLFGVLAFALWSFHLLFCVVKGNFRLGVRFLFIKLYPMEIGNTLMNAFLFNTWIILLCSVPAVQFCVQAFPIYTGDTQASVMFGTQVRSARLLAAALLLRFCCCNARHALPRALGCVRMASVQSGAPVLSAASAPVSVLTALDSLFFRCCCLLPFSSLISLGSLPHLLPLFLPQQRVHHRSSLHLRAHHPHAVGVPQEPGRRGGEDARPHCEELQHQNGSQGRARGGR